MKIIVIKGDITVLGSVGMIKVDAIVNPSNNNLEPMGGLDWAIHQRAGPDLADACIKLGRCPTGKARITKGYNFPVKWIIHTAGPIVWKGLGLRKLERDQLRNCYLSILKIAREKNIKTIAIPAISTGAFGFPKKEAAEIAIATVREFVAINPTNLTEVYFVIYNEETEKIYEDILGSKRIEIDSLVTKETGFLAGLKKLANW